METSACGRRLGPHRRQGHAAFSGLEGQGGAANPVADIELISILITVI
jgi:hypothetical protein